ncbi:F-box/kelch-repeat protein At3g23880-like [Lotus japonicus]|uniref:F-box/kelch-repeat protein At3g23880-like n=1 Tax=Lotus japonicus TaxID=34305 RepID=UPI00258B406F|nr:F-box/kelch-repeat protein At3g23880-like [Lotus japonicus]XP_057439635.1 F-box/kelch-repeat protein At3g23880-like [Lotus japonicus]XP_057439636.1 F-box/kelch-repeat protein At3g23880-like [Lotus japonicus]XP_057439638.1 F-box/kelch-repeat protein At3g23880-like [Lotus japonicus]XP_057439639.1 F-box/kelch-repeat protein At3g23880-like [Lotus japonicus]XP_057439640.1 F-box/kelch-repeat protein At3g23880-like [Lotus japonicus]
MLEHMNIHIDPDLITEILLRLPVKSLMRFKAVCKLWRSLISDPHFATSHFQRASPTLLFASCDAIRTIDFEGPLHYDHVSQPINYHLVSSTPIKIAGSCRGFLLIEYNDTLYVWNPSTHVHISIPPSFPVNVVDSDTDDVFTHLYGFGYHSSKDDYLVVQVPVPYNYATTYLPHVQFFSFRANMWKYTEGVDLPPLNSIDCSHGLLFNEAIHWVARNWVDGITTYFIIAFDLMEKRLLEIPQPHDFLAHRYLTNLWVHGRYFSLSVERRDYTCEIWVMKKYKVQTSWTKTVVLSFDSVDYPVCSTKGGDIVMLSGDILKKYSDEGVVQGEQLDSQNDSSYCGFLNPSAPLYTESMLSLPDISD